MAQRRQRVASATQTTKPSARSRRSAACGRRSVVGTEACGFVHRRSAVRIPSGCVAPTGTNAAHGADTKARRVLRRDTKRLRGSSRSLDSELSQEFAQRHRARRDSSCSPALRETVDMRIRLSDESLTRSHGGTEFLHGMMGVYRFSFLRLFSVAPCLRVRYPVFIETRMSMNGREKSESLFVNRLVGEPFSCRTEWARSTELLREKVINTERPTAGRLEVTGSFASRRSVGFVASSGHLGLTRRTRRGRDAKVRKDLCLVAVYSLGDLCVKAFAAFALKKTYRVQNLSQKTRSTSLATLPLPREAALC